MPAISAGLLLYRRRETGPEVFLVHPGGPYWARKDGGAWSVPKGLVAPGEAELACARREFREETGVRLEGAMIPLGPFKQPSGKIIEAWALEGDCDPATIRSNEFEMEWPPRSGRKAKFPEVDRAGWFEPELALVKANKGQLPIIAALRDRLGI